MSKNIMSYMFTIKKSDEDPDDEDGFRILVDQIWPSGLSKDNVRLDLWMKDIAPSNRLIKMFKEDKVNFDSFKDKYLEELKGKKELIKQLKILEKYHNKITLVYSPKDDNKNAAILMELLNQPTKQVIMGIPRIHGS
jgi:uncharacterized protein YeaO (DUF488 family)